MLVWLDADACAQWVLTLEDVEPASSLTSFGCYSRLDQIAARLPHDANAATDASGLFAKRQLVQVDGERSASDAIDEASLDVLLDLRAIGAPRFSAQIGADIWSNALSGPDGAPIAGREPVFQAIAAGFATAAVQLLRSSKGEDSHTVIASATLALAPSFLATNVSRCNWKREALFRRELTRLHAEGGELVRDARMAASPPAGEPGAIPLARGRAVARVVLRLAKDISSRRVSNVRTREQWIVGIRRNDGRGFDRSAGFDVIAPPPDRFYADPFVISQADRTYVFIEEYLFGTKKGIISVMEIGDNGLATAPMPVLERPYHLSYPFVFREGDDYFMIPETAAHRTVELYRAVQFPHRWVLERVLLDDIRALDSSITVQDGRYWLFTSFETPGRNRNDELFLYSADSLGGQWTPHPRNPVVSDVRGARPAGRPFRRGAELIRPAQDCSTRYGRAVVFQRIVAMNEREYREETVGTMEPVWTAGILGTHTYNVDDRYEVVDGVRVIPRRRRMTWLRAQ